MSPHLVISALALLLALPALGQGSDIPPLPTADELRAMRDADPRETRAILRRAARTAPDAERRAIGLGLLARRDPTRATARICARALRVDDDPRVRRTGAECLGRLPPSLSVGHTPDLTAALDDENIDVVTMAGWALANGGDRSGLEPLTQRATHEDPRVARLFYGYTKRMRARLGIRDQAKKVVRAPPGTPQLVPRATELMNSDNNLESTFAGSWLAVYGGMVGWLHGTTFPAAYGGQGFQSSVPLTALAGTVTGLAVGGAYGFLRVKTLVPAHTVVQLGALGTLTGYGAGMLSAFPPKRGLNTAAFSLVGTTVGTTLGVVLVEMGGPTPGAVALGLSAAVGAGVTFGGLAAGYGFPLQQGPDGPLGGAVGVAFFAAGIGGTLTTLIAAPYDIRLADVTLATVGGLTGATVLGLTVGLIENGQLATEFVNFTEGSGWAIAGGYAIGTALGIGVASLIPDDADPFAVAGLQLKPPTFAAIPDARDPRRTVPMALLEGSF
jgi:hypothetical protein